jgi:hypothetical protein
VAKDRLFNGVAGDRARQYRANPTNDEVDDSRTLEADVIVAPSNTKLSQIERNKIK